MVGGVRSHARTSAQSAVLLVIRHACHYEYTSLESMYMSLFACHVFVSVPGQMAKGQREKATCRGIDSH